MLEYDRIDISEGTDANKTSKSKKKKKKKKKLPLLVFFR